MSDAKHFEFGTFLDVRSCGSSVSGYVVEPTIERFYDETSKWWLEGQAVLNLTDCSRSISWDFGNPSRKDVNGAVYNIEKMKKVLDTMQAFYDKLVEANAACTALREKVAAHNEALKNKETAND